MRSDPCGALACTSPEQGAAQMTAAMQQHLMRDRQEYGPVISSGRVSPRVAQIGSMVLTLDDVEAPLPPPASLPPTRGSSSRMEDHYQAILRELNAKSDEVAALFAQRSDQDKTIQMAEAHLRDKETELRSESQQRDLAMSLARRSISAV